MRIRLRTVLVVVAVVAVLLKAEMTRRRWASYSRQAAFHAAERRNSERILQALEAEIAAIDRRNARLRRPLICGNGRRTEEAVRSLAATYATSAAQHARLAKEYRRRW
jgi:hypothetical protein